MSINDADVLLKGPVSLSKPAFLSKLPFVYNSLCNSLSDHHENNIINMSQGSEYQGAYIPLDREENNPAGPSYALPPGSLFPSQYYTNPNAPPAAPAHTQMYPGQMTGTVSGIAWPSQYFPPGMQTPAVDSTHGITSQPPAPATNSQDAGGAGKQKGKPPTDRQARAKTKAKARAKAQAKASSRPILPKEQKKQERGDGPPKP